ncbi:unnamed protein product [Vicia faba]|uniref:Uncharacterized protein n=1 Tax=Vicia faba TaxID=3906 RepID=A0AAV1AYD7_VICFA|nr:unnamed protein product [Vicia faba]
MKMEEVINKLQRQFAILKKDALGEQSLDTRRILVNFICKIVNSGTGSSRYIMIELVKIISLATRRLLKIAEATISLEQLMKRLHQYEAMNRYGIRSWPSSSATLSSFLFEKVNVMVEEAGCFDIFHASTGARCFCNLGLPAIGFSPLENTHILLHDHNEDEVVKLSPHAHAIRDI